MGRADKVRLVYNTNMTKLNYNKNYLPDFWKQFKKVTLGLSIDSFGDRANYIRHGSVKWNKIEANIKEMSKYANKAESNIDYFFSPTVSLLNVYTLTDLHQYLFDADLIVGIDSILLNILHGPADLSMLNLPRNIKDDIQLKIEKHISWIQANGGTERSINQFKSLSDFLDTTLPDVEGNIRTFIQNTRDIDRRRNENFSDTFPEYKDWWEEITKNSIPTVNI